MKALRIPIFITLVLMSSVLIGGQTVEQKVVEAIRADEDIEIDGVLKENTWQTQGYSDFTQRDPKDGEPPTEKTTFWVVFDDEAIYVAARMFDSESDKIVSRLSRRDDSVDSDWFLFSVDPYYDRRSGYQFAVSPAGSIIDWTIYNDEFRDTTWDGVWESAAQIDEKGWTVEIRIPYNQLRFKKKDNYTWGVNFRRIIQRKNEEDVFSWVPKEESGFASHFAKLVGIRDINPGRLIELLPFTANKAAFSPAVQGNPFETGKSFTANGGLDMKMGLKSNLTLDLTANPDFGQVEVDPAVINLSAAETYYQEKRPFFIEGANIFRFGYGGATSHWGVNWSSPSFFYSRRIGRPPRGYVDSDGYVKYPDWSTILMAAKITGKIGKDWNFGLLSALTERESADIDLNGQRLSEEVEPFTYHGVLRAQKEFNQGMQGLGFITTGVVRDLQTEVLENSLNRKAFSLALDGWTFLDENRTWVFSGWLGGTRVSGSQTAIFNLQNSYPHYYQRPDATHVELSEDATSLSGWAGRFLINKQKGNIMFNASLGAVSPGFDSTDMGYQGRADIINSHVMVGYRSLHPGKILRNWSVFVFTQRNYNFGGDKIGEQRLILFSNYQFLNYWGAYFQMSVNPKQWSHTLTRGGPLTLTPAFTWYDFSINSDDRKPVVLSFGGYYFSGKSGDQRWIAYTSLRWRPKSNISLSLSPEYTSNNTVAQWVTRVEDELMTETYGSRYIFAHIDQKTLSFSLRLNWIFTPKLSLQAYIQPFIAVGDYDRFKELARAKSFDFNQFGAGDSTINYMDGDYIVDPDGPNPAHAFSFGNPDFNYKSLRGTIVLRWEYRPGSLFYLVWTQNRADFANPGDFNFSRDFGNLFTAPGDNIFMVKFTYRFKL